MIGGSASPLASPLRLVDSASSVLSVTSMPPSVALRSASILSTRCFDADLLIGGVELRVDPRDAGRGARVDDDGFCGSLLL